MTLPAPRIPCSAAELERLRAVMFDLVPLAQGLERHGNELGAALIMGYACELAQFMVGLQRRLWQWRRCPPALKVGYRRGRPVRARPGLSTQRGARRRVGSGRRPTPRRPRGPITG